MTNIESAPRTNDKKKLAGLIILTAILSVGIASSAIYLNPSLRYSPIVKPTVTDIDPLEFYKMKAENPENFLFIDVRQPTTYTKEHAEGSENIPLHKLYTEKDTLPRGGKTIVLICSGGSASGVGYSYLEHYGFRNVLRIAGGIENWKAEGLPVVAESEAPLN